MNLRYSRLRRFPKSNQKLMISGKIMLIGYVMIFTVSYLTSNTTAYFSDSSNETLSIQAGTWFDGSNLQVGSHNGETIAACPQEELQVVVKNTGFSMTGPTEYEIYYSTDGEPNQNGEKVEEGQIQPIEQNGSITLSYQASADGAYMFKVYQRPGYGENDEGRTEIWSSKIVVSCDQPEEEILEEEPEVIEEPQEVESDNKETKEEQPVTDSPENKEEEVEAPVEETPEPTEGEDQPEEPETPANTEESDVIVEDPEKNEPETPDVPEPDEKNEKNSEEG
ncbi:hypothetical protein Q75_15685 [Bacillus coahuilensis p1.1.43]|uniref:Amyloid fiber anchoring/assembly protein TapA n=1 Tax=Bacillus coahuilensis p1.1.43 TaxID=1150625 RepID=A0A147K4R9_9BACI|nr:amyloid fiber anchoring/assembly protein TapA [Bacillus coahuilensis]KUP04429.1 hypothetical protein Q75_15685 [Bacillus coahuilensis p1.1.43]